MAAMESSIDVKKEVMEEDAVVMAAGGERGDDKVVGGVIISDEVDETYSSESDEGVWCTSHEDIHRYIFHLNLMLYRRRESLSMPVGPHHNGDLSSESRSAPKL
jgi:hypothetical protein